MSDKISDAANGEMSPEQAALLTRRVRMMMVIAGLTIPAPTPKSP